MSHLLHLSTITPQNKNESGYRIEVGKNNFPLLKGMSFYKLVLYEKGIREPHWHANADELGCCVKGKALVTIYASGNVRNSFLVSPGDAFFIPSGSLHAIENVGEESSEFILSFSSDSTEDFALSSMFGMFTDGVLGNTWGVSGEKFKSLSRSTKAIYFTSRKGQISIPKESYYDSAYRYHLEGATPLISVEGGTARVARKDVWPALQRQALYSLHLNGTGMREPHWHPGTSELGYVHKGTGRMSILSPNGTVDTYEMNEGDIYFIPPAYPHHIENMTTGELKLFIFFDQAMPSDIGLTASVKSNSNEVLSSGLGVPNKLFEELPTYYEDLFIVNKVNPVD